MMGERLAGCIWLGSHGSPSAAGPGRQPHERRGLDSRGRLLGLKGPGIHLYLDPTMEVVTSCHTFVVVLLQNYEAL